MLDSIKLISWIEIWPWSSRELVKLSQMSPKFEPQRTVIDKLQLGRINPTKGTFKGWSQGLWVYICRLHRWN